MIFDSWPHNSYEERASLVRIAVNSGADVASESTLADTPIVFSGSNLSLNYYALHHCLLRFLTWNAISSDGDIATRLSTNQEVSSTFWGALCHSFESIALRAHSRRNKRPNSPRVVLALIGQAIDPVTDIGVAAISSFFNEHEVDNFFPEGVPFPEEVKKVCVVVVNILEGSWEQEVRQLRLSGLVNRSARRKGLIGVFS